MGEQSRRRQQITLAAMKEVEAHRELVLGPALPWGAHDEACPGCGTPKMIGETLNREYRFCPGHVATLPEEVEQPCGLPGHHLDVACKSCARIWRTVTFEDRDQEPRSPLEP